VGLLGEKWQPAVLTFQILALAGIPRALSEPAADMLRALGSAKLLFRMTLLQGLLMLVGLLLLAPRGIEIVALTITIIVSLTSWAIIVSPCRKLGISIWSLIWACTPGIALAMSGAGPIVFFKLLGSDSLPFIVQLAVLSIGASLGIIVCLTTAYRGLLRDIVELVPSFKRR